MPKPKGPSKEVTQTKLENIPGKLNPTQHHASRDEPILSSQKTVKQERNDVSKRKVIKGTFLHKIALMKIPFNQLPGWNKADLKKSLIVFS